MKATGIVRRIEEYGIIGQKPWKPHKHSDFSVFWLNLIYIKSDKNRFWSKSEV